MSEESLPPNVQIPPGEAAFDAGQVQTGAFQNPPPDVFGGRKEALVWLLVFVVFIAMLICASQIALLRSPEFGSADTRARITADYGLWPRRAIPAVNPAILREIALQTPLPTEIQVVSVWETLQLPTAPSPTPSVTATPRPSRTPRPTLAIVVDTPVPPRPTNTIPVPTPRPTRARSTLIPQTTPQNVPTRTPTRFVPTATHTLRPTTIPTRTHTPTITLTPTITPSPTNTRRPTRTLTPSHTPTRTATHTRPPTRTNTPTPTNTITLIVVTTAPPTNAITITTTLTPGTPIVPETPQTPTPPTRTPIATWINEGTPDGSAADLDCGASVMIDFADRDQPINSLVFYEEYNQQCNGICLDTIKLLLSNNENPSNDPNALVFYWGDDNLLNNGYIFAYHYQSTPIPASPEADNEVIPSFELYPNNEANVERRIGVCIAIPTPGPYRYLQIAVPDNCNDYSQIDAFELNVNLDLCPVPTPTQ